jgi:spore germination protein YaaH
LIERPAWRARFIASTVALLAQHPRLAGVHLNIEPCPSGDRSFLALLDGMRSALPPGSVLSVAAYPPPTAWQPVPDIHWDEGYYREVASRCDQMVVMAYDTGLKLRKPYQRLVADWTVEVLAWSAPTQVLIGLPAYEDAGVGYHHPWAENLATALAGMHAGLGRAGPPAHYQGAALYSEWEMEPEEWATWEREFLKR